MAERDSGLIQISTDDSIGYFEGRSYIKGWRAAAGIMQMQGYLKAELIQMMFTKESYIMDGS